VSNPPQPARSLPPVLKTGASTGTLSPPRERNYNSRQRSTVSEQPKNKNTFGHLSEAQI
jgi:hypothetical protein